MPMMGTTIAMHLGMQLCNSNNLPPGLVYNNIHGMMSLTARVEGSYSTMITWTRYIVLFHAIVVFIAMLCQWWCGGGCVGG